MKSQKYPHLAILQNSITTICKLSDVTRNHQFSTYFDLMQFAHTSLKYALHVDL